MNTTLTSAELAVISEIETTSSLLRLVTRLTGLRFAAIAKVTESSWTACAVYDEINFGLEAGHELKLENTFCNELRLNHQPIVINEVATDPVYADHAIPKMFKFQSYFSLPIIFPTGDFFGTLCGLDLMPKKLDDEQLLDTLKVFCTLIANTLYAHQQLTMLQAQMGDLQPEPTNA
ncbi:GAF domain-containing protein [Pseudomonas viridiflava]|uniref:GAF domain-containing protein n=1 Tax=Pseudomonas viridiflava TaxID=33069 RepID=UPI0015E2D4D7|nr:GAF domain-containing protein [Pseudomonas viridiflava]MBA1231948.1 GAF domain-containing protein [Pseudomonas viridiflava]